MNRPRQTNCQQEPAYPGADTVVFSIRDPMMTVHRKRDDCPIEEPHSIVDCGAWTE
jgi:hypothetical protein